MGKYRVVDPGSDEIWDTNNINDALADAQETIDCWLDEKECPWNEFNARAIKIMELIYNEYPILVWKPISRVVNYRIQLK